MSTKMPEAPTVPGVVLGLGLLNWARGERVSGRYGMVSLYGVPTRKPGMLVSESMEEQTLFGEVCRSLKGKHGWLRATALETRQSDHIGDLFRGIGPVTPEVGEDIVLGYGTLVYEEGGGEMPFAVGLSPDDGRDNDWLDPVKLYRCHSQTVRLEFVPESA